MMVVAPEFNGLLAQGGNGFIAITLFEGGWLFYVTRNFIEDY
jgi:hypothetical protein